MNPHQLSTRVPKIASECPLNSLLLHPSRVEDGTFRLEQLVPGHDEYFANLIHRSDGALPHLAKFTVKPGESVDLRDLTIPPPPRPYTPPTPEERIADAFSVQGTPTERMN